MFSVYMFNVYIYISHIMRVRIGINLQFADKAVGTVIWGESFDQAFSKACAVKGA